MLSAGKNVVWRAQILWGGFSFYNLKNNAVHSKSNVILDTATAEEKVLKLWYIIYCLNIFEPVSDNSSDKCVLILPRSFPTCQKKKMKFTKMIGNDRKCHKMPERMTKLYQYDCQRIAKKNIERHKIAVEVLTGRRWKLTDVGRWMIKFMTQMEGKIWACLGRIDAFPGKLAWLHMPIGILVQCWMC